MHGRSTGKAERSQSRDDVVSRPVEPTMDREPARLVQREQAAIVQEDGQFSTHCVFRPIPRWS
jgi:hypothetical protein